MNQRKDMISTNGWVSFIESCIFVFIFPFIPLAIEYFTGGYKISGKSATLASSMYAISIGVTSKYHILFVLCVLISIAEAILYGYVLHNENDKIMMVLLIATGFVTIYHCAERFYRHVIKKEPFFEFGLVNY